MSAPMRIYRPQTKGVTAGDDFKSYLDRLMKMIPGEVVGLYLVGRGVIPKGEPVPLLVWIGVCLLAVVATKAYGTSDRSSRIPTDWTHVAISAVAFLIWVYSMGDPAFGRFVVSYVSSLLVLAWTFFVPIFYKGQTV